MKKVLKWTQRIIFILVGVILITKFISSLLFSILINLNYKEYRWKGNWKSANDRFITGYLVTNLPYTLPLNRTIPADAIVFQHFYTFEHVFSSEKMAVTSTVFPNKGVLINDSLSVGFQAALVGIHEHQIELVGSVNLNRTLITGSYRSIHPDDMGTFSLAR